MFQQAAYAASATMNHHDLLFHQLAEAHEDRGNLGAGGVRLRAEETVGTLNQALTDGPLHRGDGPRTDVGSVRKLGQILRERDRFEAVFHGIAEEHRHKLLARDRAGHIRAVGDFVLHCPALTSGAPRCAGGALAVQTRQNCHDHAARGIRVRGENLLLPVPFMRPLSTTQLTAEAYQALSETSTNLVLPASGLNEGFAGLLGFTGVTGVGAGVCLPHTLQVVPAVCASPHGVLQTLQIPKW